MTGHGAWASAEPGGVAGGDSFVRSEGDGDGAHDETAKQSGSRVALKRRLNAIVRILYTTKTEVVPSLIFTREDH